jgi:hypothetical protein
MEIIMFLHIEHVEYIEDYSLRIRFNNGIEKEIDLSSDLYGEIFEPLKNINTFRNFYINQNTNTIEWENGADFAPEYLFEIGKEIKKSA